MAFELLPTTPQGVTDQVLSNEVGAMQGRGELAVNEWTANARPASGWNLDGFLNFKAKNAASVPPFPGAQTPSAWLDQAKPFVSEHEGNQSFAYHGALTSFRRNGEMWVKPGHASKEEVSVGYGFNLQRRDAKDVFEKQLGLTGQDYDDVFNGRRGLSAGESEKLLMYGLYEANAYIDSSLRGVPLRDHQRAALSSLVYNAGIGAVSKSGLLESVRAGNDAETASRILKFATGDGHLTNRRRDEAALYLGAQADQFFRSRKLN